MTTRAEIDKLAEFRAKTDRELHELLSNRLDRGLAFARLLLDDEARQRWASMDEFAVQAERSYADVSKLMPYVRGVSIAERRQLEARLIQLREILDSAAPSELPRMRAAAAVM